MSGEQYPHCCWGIFAHHLQCILRVITCRCKTELGSRWQISLVHTACMCVMFCYLHPLKYRNLLTSYQSFSAELGLQQLQNKYHHLCLSILAWIFSRSPLRNYIKPSYFSKWIPQRCKLNNSSLSICNRHCIYSDNECIKVWYKLVHMLILYCGLILHVQMLLY